jgi:hypothetical protein
MKVEVRKEINISNATIVNELIKDGGILENLEEKIGDILYLNYDIDYDSSCDAVSTLTTEDYIEIFQMMARKMKEKG